MPLSKKRNKERMKQKRATCVQPSGKTILAAINYLDNAPMPTDNRLIWTEEDGVQPIPNCPDGRYRDATKR